MIKRYSNFKWILLALLIITVILLFYPHNVLKIYQLNYVLNAIYIFIVLILLYCLHRRKGLDLLEPIVLITIIYIAMFVVTPMIDIVCEEYFWYGYDLFPYGIKATFIALLGYISFYFFYSFNIFKKASIKNVKLNEEIIYNRKSNSILICFILLMYTVCFIANVYYMIQRGGFNLTYILTLGIFGDVNKQNITDNSIGYISMLSYSLPTTALLYVEFGKNKFLKVLLFLVMFILQISRGFRFFVIQIAIMFFSYFYIRNNKRPKVYQILQLLLLLLIPIVIMTLFRNSIRDGNGINLDILNIESIVDGLNAAIMDNFRIYQNFYGMVNVIPNRFDYVFGRQIIIGTLVMIIPRAIWPNKLSSYGGEGLSTLIGPNIGSGQAYPNIGEFYYSFGTIGVVFFMGIYGFWMKTVKQKYMKKENGALSNMIYVILLSSNLQLIIRGYTPSNFYFVLFSLLPIYFIKNLFK